MIINLGKRERTLKFTTNSICDLEASEKISVIKMLDEQAGLNTLRLLLWTGLRHENRGLTKDMVGDWIQDYITEKEDGLAELFEITVKELIDSGALGNVKAENQPK